MPLLAFPAVFMREAAPAAPSCSMPGICSPREEYRDPIFLAAMGSPDPNRTTIERHGRRDFLAFESLRAGAVAARRCRYRLHFRSGANPRGGGGLSQQLRQHELCGWTVRSR